MVPEINYWAVLIATASSMVVGSIWYAQKVFGTRWAKLANVDMDRPGASAVAADHRHGVRQLHHGVGARGCDGDRVALLRRRLPVDGDRDTVALWAGFTAARFITHDAFEGRPTSLTVLNIAHELVTVLIMALIIGVWPPAGTV